MIRRATTTDAGAIGELQLRAWRRNYQDIVDPRYLAGLDDASRAEHWAAVLVAGTCTTVVADVAGAVRGVASVTAGGPGDGGPEKGELLALYVDPPAQGAGLGTALLEAALDELRAAGHATATLRVLRDNGLARALFEGRGWTPVAGDEAPHAWGVPELRYRRDL